MESSWWKIIAVVAVITLLGLGIAGIVIGVQYSKHPENEGVYKAMLYIGLGATFVSTVSLLYILLRVYSNYEMNVMTMNNLYTDLNKAYVQAQNGQTGFQQFTNRVGSSLGALDYCMNGVCSPNNYI